jgi:hypothetical protein
LAGALVVVRSRQESVPVVRMCALKVSRSTTAAAKRGSVKVVPHSETGALETMATEQVTHQSDGVTDTLPLFFVHDIGKRRSSTTRVAIRRAPRATKLPSNRCCYMLDESKGSLWGTSGLPGWSRWALPALSRSRCFDVYCVASLIL